MHENWLAILEISKGPLIGGQNFKTRIFYSEIWILLKKLAEESAFVFFIFSRVLRDSTPRYVGLSVGWLVGWSSFWAAAPKGSMTYAFTREFSPFGQRPRRGR